MAEETRDLLLNDVPVWVLDAFQREADRHRRSRAAQLRHALEIQARRYIAREQRQSPPPQESDNA